MVALVLKFMLWARDFDYFAFREKVPVWIANTLGVCIVVALIGVVGAQANEGGFNPFDLKGASNGAIFNTNINNNVSFISDQVGALAHSANTVVSGLPPEDLAQAMGIDTTSEYYTDASPWYKNGGASAYAANLVRDTEHALPAINVPEYFARNFLPEPVYNTTAYAQDQSTEDFLKSIKLDTVWTVAFNLSMVGFVIIAIVAGFMVMFRSRLGQGSVTVSNAIMRIIIGVALSLGSFTIAALIIDFGKWLTAVIRVVVLQPAAPAGLGITPVYIDGPISLAANVFGLNLGTNTGIGTGAVYGFTSGWQLISLVSGIGTIPVGLILILTILTFGVIVLIASFKIFIKLITIYVRLLFDVIFAPFIILIASIPGREEAINEWLKRLFANSLSIPAIYFFVNLAVFFAGLDIPFLYFTGAGGASTAQDTIYYFKLSQIIAVVVYMLAAGGDDYVREMLKISDAKAIGAAVGGTQAAAKKVPIVGGLLG